MNIRWLWLDFVNPEVPLSPAQRRRVRRAMLRSRRYHTSDPFRLLAVAPLGVAAIALLIVSIPHFLPISWAEPDFGVRLLGFAGATWLAAVALTWLLFHHRVIECAQRLRTNHCLRCGYPLANLAADSTRCPECGEAFPAPSS